MYIFLFYMCTFRSVYRQSDIRFIDIWSSMEKMFVRCRKLKKKLKFEKITFFGFWKDWVFWKFSCQLFHLSHKTRNVLGEVLSIETKSRIIYFILYLVSYLLFTDSCWYCFHWTNRVQLNCRNNVIGEAGCHTIPIGIG